MLMAQVSKNICQWENGFNAIFQHIFNYVWWNGYVMKWMKRCFVSLSTHIAIIWEHCSTLVSAVTLETLYQGALVIEW